MTAFHDRRRARVRRPISDAEALHLEEMGRGLRQLREDEGIPRTVVAERADLSYTYVRELERGTSRPRPATVKRIVQAVYPEIPSEEQDALTRDLLDLAGPAVAPDLTPEEAERRRLRRARRQARAEYRMEKARPMAEEMAKQMAREMTAEAIRNWRTALGLRVAQPRRRAS